MPKHNRLYINFVKPVIIKLLQMNISLCEKYYFSIAYQPCFRFSNEKIILYI